ncbi:MAG TPA: ubiquinone/menaquinone biosynthesis methyltransferase [Verrucomicrobiae bacterium]|nr:ubiquinone/menaquinone biosynthesis methyltransferase [Verrucomicrobiae bacterium]
MASGGYYDPGARRADKVQALFGRIAARYDLLNDLQSFGMHRGWKRRVARLARPVQGDRAVDVCCGTGDIAFAVAASGADVVGIDFNEKMLGEAARRSARAPMPPGTKLPRFLAGDAQELPFGNDSFEIVTMGYGLRNLAKWERGVEEMARVARPGGRIVVLEFGKPSNSLWRSIYFGYLKVFVPLLGRIACGDARAYGYILESLRDYPGQRAVAEKMRQTGLRETRVFDLFGGAMAINYAEK